MGGKKQQPAMPGNFELRGVGKQMAKHLARLNIFSVEDLLLHIPSRYQDRTHIEPIRNLVPDQEAVVEGIIKNASSPAGGRTRLLCELADETGTLLLRFFHVMTFQKDTLRPGTHLRAYGIVRHGPRGLEIIHPEFQAIREGNLHPVDQHFTPIYPSTEGLSQTMLRKLTSNALSAMAIQNTFVELLPESVLQRLSFPTLKEALHFIHRPPRTTEMPLLEDNQTPAQKRLVFEELLAHRISLLRIKQKFQFQKSVSLFPGEAMIKKFLDNLPFQLTMAQKRVVQEISKDLSRDFPMLRLVQGDVGSGKTVIAALAMLQAVENGCQAAIMAPTELLAEQHYRMFTRWFDPLGINVSYLSGNTKGKARKTILESIADGRAQIIIGTHALFQEEVSFSSLALIVVDEQHRFGVQQRALLREKGSRAAYYPHQLIMTATPIPRTLAMSFYADLDSSIIDELPPGRTPVRTSIVDNARREEVMLRIQEACHLGRQVYWVCPLIEESETLSCQAATRTAETLGLLLKNLKVGLVHGRMRADEKEAVMKGFQEGETHLLVATTVIEVGVDVPNASVMIIENAERLGLSQLHQLRGRVGRGAIASHCILLYQQPLSDIARQRLSVMRETTDGFRISEKDLELRGPGEILGTRQTGGLSFRVADMIRDNDMLTQVHQIANMMMQEHAEMIDPLIIRWLGERGEYGKV